MDHPRTTSSALALLDDAHACLAEAAGAGTPAGRYVAAHLSALRSAAAVLATRARPAEGRRRVRSAWELLPKAAPEMAEWAAYFAASAIKRAAAEAGVVRVVTAREADDLLRDAQQFVSLVEETLGLGGQPPLPLELAG